MRLRFFLPGFLLLLPLLQAAPRPNIVVILADDLGFSDLGCYGSEIPTPHLDALAKNGLRFSQFYNTARCSTTRASLMTGLYPHQAGMGFLDGLRLPQSRGTHGRLHERCVTMAQVLGQAGYHTSMVGKWHLGQQHGTPPWLHGFARSATTQYGELYFPKERSKPDCKWVYLDGRKVAADSPEVGEGNWYSTFMFTDWSLKFISEAKQSGRPFFHYFAHGAPHFPLKAPADRIAKFRGRYKAGWDVLRKARHERQLASGLVDKRWPLPERPAEIPAWNDLSPQEQDRQDQIMAIYAAMIEAVDESVGRVVSHLRAEGMLDNTLIVFLSDNGGNAEGGPLGITQGEDWGGPDSHVLLGMGWATVCNTPLRRYKHFTHEGGISSPFIVHWPAGLPAARRGQLEHQPAHLVDLMPTFVQAADAVYPARWNEHSILPMQGIPLQPALRGEPLHRVTPIFWMHEGNRGLRIGPWKLVQKFKEPWELYRIDEDRSEQNDLFKRFPAMAEHLSWQWEDWAASSFVDEWQGQRRSAWGDEPRPPGKAKAKGKANPALNKP